MARQKGTSPYHVSLSIVFTSTCNYGTVRCLLSTPRYISRGNEVMHLSPIAYVITVAVDWAVVLVITGFARVST